MLLLEIKDNDAKFKMITKIESSLKCIYNIFIY